MRATGRTTRAADDAIQELFHLGECYVWDHYKDGKDFKSNRRLSEIILSRISNEHPQIIDQLEIRFEGKYIVIAFKNENKKRT